MVWYLLYIFEMIVVGPANPCVSPDFENSGRAVSLTAREKYGDFLIFYHKILFSIILIQILHSALYLQDGVSRWQCCGSVSVRKRRNPWISQIQYLVTYGLDKNCQLKLKKVTLVYKDICFSLKCYPLNSQMYSNSGNFVSFQRNSQM